MFSALALFIWMSICVLYNVDLHGPSMVLGLAALGSGSVFFIRVVSHFLTNPRVPVWMKIGVSVCIACGLKEPLIVGLLGLVLYHCHQSARERARWSALRTR